MRGSGGVFSSLPPVALLEAVEAWSRADERRVSALAAYTARLAVVNKARAEGDWSYRTDPEHAAWQKAEAAAWLAIGEMSRVRELSSLQASMGGSELKDAAQNDGEA